MGNIHPTAVIHPDAKIGNDVTIDAFTFVEKDVEIGDGTKIGPHVCIYDGSRIGKNVKIFQGAAVSNAPQDLKYAGEEAHFIIGDNTVIREFTTLHRGTVDKGFSSIGANCLLMAYAHVAHDCTIGDNCIIANSVQIGGHVEIEDYVIVGGCTPIHQFSKVGQHCMVGGGFRVIADVPPYVIAGGEPLRYAGLNLIGLRRRGFSNEDIATIKEAYNILYNSGLNTTQAKDKLKDMYSEHLHVKNILNFLEKSNRSLIRR
jgi:UDP-N-acetylglucosamine acyltransferase